MKGIYLALIVLILLTGSASAALTDGLVRAFTFDNAFSNTTYTISQVGDGNGTVMGGAVNGSSCLINQCYSYDGTDDFINLSTSVQLRQPKNFTISIWANRSASTQGMFIAGRATLTDRDWWMWLGSGDSNSGEKWEGVTKLDGNNYAMIGNTTNDAPQNVWTHLAIVVNETHAQFWVNGSLIRAVAFTSGMNITNIDTYLGRPLVGGNNWQGQIDELYIYNRAVTAGEIAQLYNNGTGTQYPFTTTGVTVSLISPISGASISDTGTNFTASYTPVNLNLTNATYYVWSSNSSLFNQTTVTVTGSTSNSTTLFIDSFTIGNYLWNVKVCGINLTGDGVCSFAVSNNTLIVSFAFGNTTYNSNAFETDMQEFNLSIATFPGILSASGFLHYNGTRHLATSVCSGSICDLTATIDIPLIKSVVTSELKSFFWNITQFDGSTSSSGTTTPETQNVTRIYLQNCNVNVTALALNFTAWDEQNRTRISPFMFKATFNFWLGGGSVFRNQTFDNSTNTERTICISPSNETFKADAHIEYDSLGANDTYNERTYFFQNASITNNTQHIRLFLLLGEFSTSFIQRAITTSQIPVEQALIFQQRYYPEDNTFETVSISQTDGNGQSVGFYEVEIPDYRHLISKNGQLLKVTEQGKIFPETAPFTLIFTIGETFTSPWEQFQGLENLFSNLSYDKNTQIVTYTWIDTSGTLSVANLTVEKVYASRPNEVICSQFSIMQAGILTCNVTGQTGTLTAKAYVGRSPSVLVQLISIIIGALRDALARPFLFLWILFLMATIGIGIYNLPAGILTTIGVIIMGSIIGITAVTWLFVWAIIAVSVWVLWEAFG